MYYVMNIYRKLIYQMPMQSLWFTESIYGVNLITVCLSIAMDLTLLWRRHITSVKDDSHGLKLEEETVWIAPFLGAHNTTLSHANPHN